MTVTSIENCLAVFNHNTGRIETWLDVDNCCVFTGESWTRKLAENMPLEAMPNDRANELREQHLQRIYMTDQALPVSEERWDEMLNVLPPERWVRGEGSQSFRMSEELAGNISSYWVKFRSGECFQVNASTFPSPDHERLVWICRNRVIGQEVK